MERTRVKAKRKGKHHEEEPIPEEYQCPAKDCQFTTKAKTQEKRRYAIHAHNTSTGHGQVNPLIKSKVVVKEETTKIEYVQLPPQIEYIQLPPKVEYVPIESEVEKVVEYIQLPPEKVI